MPLIELLNYFEQTTELMLLLRVKICGEGLLVFSAKNVMRSAFILNR